MGTFYLNHEAELYHEYLAAYNEEFYGDDPTELYHYGRKGMRRGMHLPDIIDPTRELVGKKVALARKTINNYSKRLHKYGIMARNKVNSVVNPVGGRINKEYDKLQKKKAAKDFKKKQEAYEYEEFKKYKADKAAKSKNKSLEEGLNNKSKSAAANIESMRKDLNAAVKAGDRDKITSIRKAIEKAKLDEKNRVYREKAREADQYHSSHAGEEAMADFAKKQKLAQDKAKAKSEREKMKDPAYAQQKANQKSSEIAGIHGQERSDKKKKESDYNRKRQEAYAEQMKRDAAERSKQRIREKEEDAYRRLEAARRYNRRKTVSKGYKR